ncbi:unnamed protein product [Blepharisma stoltei]|uniref:Uncharacterized protein n=1 Tax=Blepharisma stoltei TaxID=1481888 RepID=A0AAU9JHS6_9CILI|nr:unnamed protein product [Blepharisma stoltei]
MESEIVYETGFLDEIHTTDSDSDPLTSSISSQSLPSEDELKDIIIPESDSDSSHNDHAEAELIVQPNIEKSQLNYNRRPINKYLVIGTAIVIIGAIAITRLQLKSSQ